MDLYIRGIRKNTYYFGFVTWKIEPSELDQTHFQPDHKKKKNTTSTDTDEKETAKK